MKKILLVIVILCLPVSVQAYGSSIKTAICWDDAATCANGNYYLSFPIEPNANNVTTFAHCNDGQSWQWQVSNFTMKCVTYSSGGEVNTASNIGHASGSFGWYVSKSGANLNFMNFSSLSSNFLIAHNSTDFTFNLSGLELTANKGVANGYAGLDSSSKLTANLASKTQVPTIDKSQVSTSGTWVKGDLPSTTVFTDQANTWSSGTQSVNALKLTGQMDANGQTITNSGHISTIPSNTGTLLQQNGTFNGALGALTSATFTQNGHTYTYPANTGTVLLTNGSGSSLTGITSSSVSTGGHVSNAPSNSGTILDTNGTFVGTLGALASNTFSYLGHVSTIPSNTGTLLQTNGSLASLTGNLNSNGGTFTGTCSGCTISGTTAGTPTVSSSWTFSSGLTSNSDITLGSNNLVNSGHKISLPSNSGTILPSNGTLTGTLSGGTISGSIAGTPTFTGNPVTINNLVATLAGNLVVGSNGLTTGGHSSTLPSNTGTLLQTNGSLSSLTGNLNTVGGTFTGTLSSGTVSGTTAGTPTLSSLWTFNGGALIKGLEINHAAKTGSYTTVATDSMITVDATTTNPTKITLVTASGNTGLIQIIEKIDKSKNVVMIVGTSSQTLDGFSNMNLTNANDAVIVESDGSNWKRLHYPQYDISGFYLKGATQNRWFGSWINQGTPTTLTPSANTLNAVHWKVPHTILTTKIQLEIATLGSGSSCRMGIYTDNGTGYPQHLVTNSDVGTVSGASTGVKTNTFSSAITLQEGDYWLAEDCSATVPQLRAIPASSIDSGLGQLSTMGTAVGGTGYQVAFTFAALPIVFPASASIVTTAQPEILVLITG